VAAEPAAQDQDANAKSQASELAPIIVTGSRIPRRNLTAVSPVTVVNSDEVKFEGATLTEEQLNQLPMLNPDQGAFVSANASGTATLDLRGLGATRTLVLLNGRRMLPGDPATIAPDVNAIPSTLIKRVEVLTGGASSVYGSDAVAGVVNFILDTQLEGLRLEGQASFFQHDNRIGSPYRDALVAADISYLKGNVVNGGRQDINAAFGTAFLDGRGHVTVYAGYRELSPVTQITRDYSACVFGVEEQTPDVLECGGSPVAFPGNFGTNFGVFQIGPNRTFTPGVGFFNFSPFNFYQRSGRRYIGGGFADLKVSDALKPFAEVMYMHDRARAQVAPSGNFFGTESINCDSPLMSDQQRALVCFNGNFVGQLPIFDDGGNLVEILGAPRVFTDPVTGSTYQRGTLFIGRRNVEGGPRRNDLKHVNLRLLGGVKGDLARGLNYEASYLYGRVKSGVEYTNDLAATRVAKSLDVITDPSSGQRVCRSKLTGEDPNCVPWDIFALGAVTREATDYLGLTARRDGSVKERIGTGFVTAQLGEWGIRVPWADEGPTINAGAETRRDSIDFNPDEAFQSGDLAGTVPLTPYSGSVAVNELFGEIRIPLVAGRIVDSLAIEGGYRQSWYKNPQNRFTTNAFKLAFDLVPVRGFRLRGSHQRAVRAPNIVDLFAPLIQDFFGRDPCVGISPKATAAECARTGVSAAQYGHIVSPPSDLSNGFNSIVGGNPFLEPETATTRTLGIVLEPRFLRGFNATLDWWDIRLKGAVGEIGAQAIMDTCIVTGDPLFCGRIHRDANGSLWLTPQGLIDDRDANIGGLKLRGIDVGANYSTKLGGIGSLNAGFIGSHLSRFVVDSGGLSTPRECAGLYGFPCDDPLPRWRHKARLTWDSPAGPSLSMQWRYVGDVKLASVELRPELPFFPGDAKIPAQSYFDVTALFRVRSDYELRMGVNNILDRRPPVVASAGTGACVALCNGNSYTQLYDPLGRYVFAGATTYFK
jgi:outer membrane receptor protein involved in Fe transport